MSPKEFYEFSKSGAERNLFLQNTGAKILQQTGKKWQALIDVRCGRLSKPFWRIASTLFIFHNVGASKRDHHGPRVPIGNMLCESRQQGLQCQNPNRPEVRIAL